MNRALLSFASLCLAASAFPAAAEDAAGGAEGALDLAALNAAAPAAGDFALPEGQSALTARLQVLLDRAGSSPGVIDGYDGDNVTKAIRALETMRGLPVDGALDAEVWAALPAGGDAFVSYTVTAEDAAGPFAAIPEDYAEKAAMESQPFSSAAEMLAERFHMDVGFLQAINPGAAFAAGDSIVVADPGAAVAAAADQVVADHIVADKALGQVRAYNAEGVLLAAYPASIGSDDTPSPSGEHTIEGVAWDPVYTYDPEKNFQQGDNTEILTVPAGPNGPVGTVWIDLSEPTYGIHGTPEPSQIDKAASHGCVRLTNWDAMELAAMVKPGVRVIFEG